MLTIGKLKNFIENMDDDAIVLQKDSHSEFSYDIKNIHIGRAVLNHTTKYGGNYYDSWDNDSFMDYLEDNPDEVNELDKKYKVVLILEIE